MALGEVYKAGWSPDDVAWEQFDAAKAEPWLIEAVKAAALIEYNAPDYVGYLKRVFPDPDFHPVIEQWGAEERQHGKVLGRWAEMADPSYHLEEAFARFRAGYHPEHFDGDDAASVRGSRRGEMLARCVVESGTSSYYTAIKEATCEPVMQEIAGRIAADEYRHYKLFFETQKIQPEPELPFWKRLMVAVGRVAESDDDESAYAWYCANVPADRTAEIPYDRKVYASKVFSTLTRVYTRRHVQKLTAMILKAAGFDPQGWMAKLATSAVWQMLKLRSATAA